MAMVLVKKKIPNLSYAKTIWIDVYSFFVVFSAYNRANTDNDPWK